MCHQKAKDSRLVGGGLVVVYSHVFKWRAYDNNGSAGGLKVHLPWA